jgi:hypothetical protein
MPTQEELQARYADQYATSGHYGADPKRHNERRGRVFRWVADKVMKLAGPAGKVVEIGAGWGGLAQVLAEHDVTYQGWEPSPEIAAFPRAQGLAVCLGGLEQAVEAGVRADVVVSCAVYEHLLDQEGFLRGATELLDSGGHMVLQCPTARLPALVARWQRRIWPRRELPSVFGSLAPPWHVSLPTPRSLRLQAERSGFSVVEVAASPSGRSGGVASFLQVANEAVGRTGMALVGESWPLVMAHVFTLRAQ